MAFAVVFLYMAGVYRFLTIIFVFFALLFVTSSNAFGAPKINEFLSHPSTGTDEWVEFYNPDGIDLSAYWIDDDIDFNVDDGNTNKKQMAALLPQSTHVYAYYVLSNAMFNNSGDSVVLFSTDGTLIDQHSYGADPGENIVIARVPDGSSWVNGVSITQGSSNPSATPTPSPSPTSSPSPTASPTPVPTSTATPSPTPKPTTSPTPKLKTTPTPSPEELAEDTHEATVLGIQEEQSPSPTPEVYAAGLFNNFSPVAVGLIVFGALLLGYSAFSLVTSSKSGKIMPIDETA